MNDFLTPDSLVFVFPLSNFWRGGQGVRMTRRASQKHFRIEKNKI
jgi:hypothetical protein